MDVPLSHPHRLPALFLLAGPVGHLYQLFTRAATERARILAGIEQLPCTVTSYAPATLTVKVAVGDDEVTVRFLRKPRYTPRTGRNIKFVRVYWNGREYLATGTQPYL